MFNPNDELHRNRFLRAYEASERMLVPERERVARLVRSYAGWRGGDDATSEKRRPKIVNPMFQAVSTLTMLLCAPRPRFRVRAHNSKQEFFAKRGQLHLNKLLEEIRYEDSIQRCVLDACFKMGIGRVHMADSIPVMIEADVYADPGRPFFSTVSFHNYFCDMMAHRPGAMTFEGEKYRVPLDRLSDASVADQKVVAQLRAMAGDYGAGEEANHTLAEVANQTEGRSEQIEEELCLTDTYFPRGVVSKREGVIVTWGSKFATAPLRIRPWEGEDYVSPFPKLRFDDSPDNVMPVSLAENLEAGDNLINSLWAKAARQAKQQRDIPVYEAGAEGDASALRKAEHGEWTKITAVGQTDIIKMGGIDASLASAIVMATEAFDRQAGGLKIMAGLGPMSPTATQDQLIGAANNVSLQKKQTRVASFMGETGAGMFRQLWNDRTNFREGWQEVPGFPEVKYPDHWYPEERVGSLSDYEVTPYTMPYESPSQRLQKLLGLLSGPLATLMPMFAQSGQTPRPEEILESLADLGEAPELRRWFGASEPIEQTDEMRQSPVTSRETVRRTVGTGGNEDPMAAAAAQMGASA